MGPEIMEESQRESEPLGDGKAVFLEFSSDEDFEEYEKMENQGWKGFYKKIFNLNNQDDKTNS